MSGVRYAVISQGLWEQGAGTILMPTLTSPRLRIKVFFFPSSLPTKPVENLRFIRSVKTSPGAAVLPLLLLSVWSRHGRRDQTDLGVQSEAKWCLGSIGVDLLFIQ